VLIVGAGLAGALLALVLGRAGRKVTVFDRDADPRPSFRAEKLDLLQVKLLTELGAVACFEAANWPDAGPPASPDAPRPALQDCGAHYNHWVQAVRAAWPREVAFVVGEVARVETSPDLQSVQLQDGRQVAGRLIVMASGLAGGPCAVSRRVISANHSVSLGFSVTTDQPVAARVIEAPPGRKLGYVSVFPMPGEVRLNLFTYHQPTDHWQRAFSRDPLGGVIQAVPEVGRILGEARLLRKCEIRVTELSAIEDHVRPGLVFIGDAFSTACPASGAGVSKVLSDVQALSARHIPAWLASPGMGLEKIQAFYDDPAKQALDRRSLRQSINGRLSSLGVDRYWRLRGWVGRLRRRLASGAPHRAGWSAAAR
jgi:2-polyprenyl-6-methoxyphenol hydroxylase-like FAD-dependent oxidoreductase